MRKKSYAEKRDFSKTDESQGDTHKKERYDKPIFVIHKHDATQLHYDFRLEIGGTLKSWSVPKGPSTNPKTKRMAIPTEDHPVAYANFEGTIPKDQYGGGTVMVWDRGHFKNISEDDKGKAISLEKSYDMGTIEVFLQGKKLKGGFALIEMKSGKLKGNWLLIKMKDTEADARRNPINTQRESVLSGRTLKEIEKEGN